MYGLSAVATASVASAERSQPSKLASIPTTHLVANSRHLAASSWIDSSRLRAISGMRTLSSKLPCDPAKVIAVSVTKIANDLAMMASGPRAGLGELLLPELQKGSSIMPGKVNPVIPEVVIQVAAQVIGNDTAITIAGSQGNFELNVRVPLIARNLLESIQLLTAKSLLFAEKCVEGIEANEEGCRRSAELTLAVATALNPYIGYDKGTEIVNDAAASGRTLREVAIEHGVNEATLDKALDLRRIAGGGSGD